LLFLATLVDATEQIKLGPAVINLPHWHPAVVASNVAMLDNLLRGRFLFGIGPGVGRADAEMLGILDHDRNAMYLEAIDHILALWEGEAPYDRAGRFWNISTKKTLWPELGLGGIAKPYQKPRPPILGASADPNSKSFAMLGRRGFLADFRRCLASDRASAPLGELRARMPRRRAQTGPRELAHLAGGLRRGGRSSGTGLRQVRSREPLS
jgi:alkanesulfonate monooxygenase SsuD/methylene tetrahydromethanopterin reductase-like flavin-dependent oxidoreductase (luciferase family)